MKPPRKPGATSPPINLARERIYSVIDSIPKGKVSTYGTVGKEAGLARGARQVAAALRHLSPGRDLPWFRVINSVGKISERPGGGESAQRNILEREGIEFSATGKVDLKRFGWPPSSF